MAQPALSSPMAAGGGGGGGDQQHHHHHHHQQHGDLVSLASGGGENPVPAGPPVPPAEPHVSAALVGDVPVAPQVGCPGGFTVPLIGICSDSSNENGIKVARLAYSSLLCRSAPL